MSSTFEQTPKSNLDNVIFSILQKVFSEIFRTGIRSAKRRRLFFLLFFILLWSFFAFILHPLQFPTWDELSWYQISPTQFIAEFLSWYFALDVLIHMLFVLLGTFLSYQIVERYFAAIYGIKTGMYSDRHLLKIIFGFPREDPIKIDTSSILEKEKLKVIGGPAKVIVGVESAAIFEKPDGSVQIVGPTLNLPGSYYQLDNFERLREIYDLRNQTIHFDIRVRTKDGIPLTIKNVHLIYSIMRGSKKTTLTRPFPFSAQALYGFFYKMPSGNFVEKVTEILKYEFVNTIRLHSLTELLEHVGEPEIQRQIDLEVLEQTINNRKKRKFNNPLPKHSFFQSKRQKKTATKIIGRNHKINYFQNNSDLQLIGTSMQSVSPKSMDHSSSLLENIKFDILAHAHQYGINIDWISLGSIECPSRKIQSHLQKVWQISSENQQTDSQADYKNLVSISEKEEIESIINDIFGSANSNQANEYNEQKNKIVLSKIIGFLNNSEPLYDEESMEKRNQIKNAIRELENVLNTKQG